MIALTYCQGTHAKSPERSTHDRHPDGDRCGSFGVAGWSCRPIAFSRSTKGTFGSLLSLLNVKTTKQR